MGSRPDGWWRDRAGAAGRLIDSIAAALEAGRLSKPVTVVIEGRAREAAEGRSATPGLELVSAPGSGDDAIVEAARKARDAGEEVVVVTADRALRQRVGELGATVEGPRTFRARL